MSLNNNYPFLFNSSTEIFNLKINIFVVVNLLKNVFFLIYKFIYFWLCWVFAAACGLFSSCGEWGPLFVAVCGLLIAVASLVAEHGL